MTRRAFTLMELMAVVGLMGLLGSLSFVAWGAVTRRQADRSAREAVRTFVQSAVDVSGQEETRLAIYFRTHEIAGDEDFAAEKACRAFAVRPAGRVSRIEDGRAWDDFADEGEVCLDEGEPAFPLAGERSEWKVGDPYGRAFAVLELPRGYWVEDCRIEIVPTGDGKASESGSAALMATRPDGSFEPIGSEAQGDGE